MQCHPTSRVIDRNLQEDDRAFRCCVRSGTHLSGMKILVSNALVRLARSLTPLSNHHLTKARFPAKFKSTCSDSGLARFFCLILSEAGRYSHHRCNNGDFTCAGMRNLCRTRSEIPSGHGPSSKISEPGRCCGDAANRVPPSNLVYGVARLALLLSASSA
jgi:hypothetical protein